MNETAGMNRTVFLTCAVTGSAETTTKHPGVPVSPREIADAVVEAAKAGAAIAHVHVRDPENGRALHDVALYREVVDRIRSASVDVVINMTTGMGGDWSPGEESPGLGGPGTDMRWPEERHRPVGELLPEICTLDCGSYNSADQVYISPMPWIRRQARLIRDCGVKPEIECFDLGHVRMGRQLRDEGLLTGEPLFQLCTGIPWGAESEPESIIDMRNRLPADAHWSAFGIGRMQMPIVAQSVLLGGNARVGLEDNLYLRKGVLASNAELVGKAVDLIISMGAQIGSPAQARERFGLARQV